MAAAPPDAQLSRPAASLAAIIVNWKREAATVACARRLLAWQELAPRVIVVDNGSGGEVVARMRSALGGATVLAHPHNAGFGAANNLAFRTVPADFYLLLNNDAEIAEGAAALLLDFLRATPGAGFAGPVLEATTPPHGVISAGGRDILRHGRTHLTEAERAREIATGSPFAVDYVPGTAVLARGSHVERLAGFDEAFFFSGEMADLARRSTAIGYASYICPTSRARHDLGVAGDLRGSLYAYYSLRNRFLYARRHAARPGLSQARWGLRGLLASLASVLRRRWATARSQALAVGDGLSGRFGPAGERVPQ